MTETADLDTRHIHDRIREALTPVPSLQFHSMDVVIFHYGERSEGVGVTVSVSDEVWSAAADNIARDPEWLSPRVRHAVEDAVNGYLDEHLTPIEESFADAAVEVVFTREMPTRVQVSCAIHERRAAAAARESLLDAASETTRAIHRRVREELQTVPHVRVEIADTESGAVEVAVEFDEPLWLEAASTDEALSHVGAGEHAVAEVVYDYYYAHIDPIESRLRAEGLDVRMGFFTPSHLVRTNAALRHREAATPAST